MEEKIGAASALKTNKNKYQSHRKMTMVIEHIPAQNVFLQVFDLEKETKRGSKEKNLCSVMTATSTRKKLNWIMVY